MKNNPIHILAVSLIMYSAGLFVGYYTENIFAFPIYVLALGFGFYLGTFIRLNK